MAEDFKRHYRADSTALLDPSYEAMAAFEAGSWPMYVVFRNGRIVDRAVGLYNHLDRIRTALESVALPEGKTAARPEVAASLRETAPGIAVDAGGKPWVVLESRKGSLCEVRLRSPGCDRRVSPQDRFAYAPDVAVAPNGDVWITWCSFEGKHHDIFARRLRGKTLSEIHRVTRSRDDAMRPAAAVDSAGRLWITYYKWNRKFLASRDRDVLCRWYDGKAWGPEIRVSPAAPAVDDHTDPAIVADARVKDRVWIAWSWDYHSSLKENTLEVDQPTIFVRAVEPAGPVGEAHLVRAPDMANHAICLRPEVAAAPDGTIWCVQDAFDAGDRAVVVSAGGEKGFTSRLARPAGVGVFSAPTLAVAADGTGMLAWIEASGALRTLSYSGQAWKVTKGISVPGTCANPRVAADPRGGFWLAYEEHAGAGVTVRVKHIDR